jgi:hypothetical protein
VTGSSSFGMPYWSKTSLAMWLLSTRSPELSYYLPLRLAGSLEESLYLFQSLGLWACTFSPYHLLLASPLTILLAYLILHIV